MRFAKIPGICDAPQYVAEELLRAAGFVEIRYVDIPAAGAPAIDGVAGGTVDFTWTFVAPLLITIDAGMPITLLAGSHVGCFELFGYDQVRTIAVISRESL